MLQVWGYSPDGLSFETNCNCIPVIYRPYAQGASVMQGKYAFFISGIFGRYNNSLKSYTQWVDDIRLPKKISHDVQDGKCIVVVDDSTESFSKDDIYWTLYWFSKHNNLNKSNFVYTTNNLNFGDLDFCDVYNDCFVIEYCAYSIVDKDPEFFQPIINYRGNWQYPFINLGGEPRPHRIRYHKILRNHFPNQGISTINHGFRYKKYAEEFTPEISPYEDPNQTQPYIWHLVNPQHYIHIPIASIMETYIEEERKCITEKIFKNLVYPQPFVVLGAQGVVEEMRSRGFDVYDEYIDHSYDNIKDNQTRLVAVFNTFRSLIESGVNYFPKEKSIVEHNREVARNLTIAEKFITYLHHKLHH